MSLLKFTSQNLEIITSKSYNVGFVKHMGIIRATVQRDRMNIRKANTSAGIACAIMTPENALKSTTLQTSSVLTARKAITITRAGQKFATSIKKSS